MAEGRYVTIKVMTIGQLWTPPRYFVVDSTQSEFVMYLARTYRDLILDHLSNTKLFRGYPTELTIRGQNLSVVDLVGWLRDGLEIWSSGSSCVIGYKKSRVKGVDLNSVGRTVEFGSPSVRPVQVFRPAFRQLKLGVRHYRDEFLKESARPK